MNGNRRGEINQYEIRAALQICCKKSTLTCIPIWKVKFFWKQNSCSRSTNPSPQNSRIFQGSLIASKQSLGSGQKHVDFFLFMGRPLLLFSKKSFTLLPLNTSQLTCGSMLHVSSFVLASCIASDLTKKRPLMKFETKLQASSLLC